MRLALLLVAWSAMLLMLNCVLGIVLVSVVESEERVQGMARTAGEVTVYVWLAGVLLIVALYFALRGRGDRRDGADRDN